MNKLEINKDNYKGYIELYNQRKRLDDEVHSIELDMIKKAISVFGVYIVMMSSTNIFNLTGILRDMVILIESLIAMLSCVIVGFHYAKKASDIKVNQMVNIKELYPYVDTEIDEKELVKILEEANIKTQEKDNNGIIDNESIKKYECYLKCEEIKKDYLEEVKYNSFSGDTDIEYQELDFPKVKKLIR